MSFSFQICIICKKKSDNVSRVKKYESLDTLCCAAEQRSSMMQDQFASATQDILSVDSSTELYYHSQCNHRQCAVKRKEHEVADGAQSSSQKTTRSSSDLLQSNAKGVLLNQCMFCTVIRKRLKTGQNTFEKLAQIETLESSKVSLDAAKKTPQLETSQRILALGSKDLIAIEGKYHNSCK